MYTLNKEVRDLLLSNKNSIVNEIKQKNNFNQSNATIENSLRKLLLPYFKDVTLYTLGSREIGVATSDSDLDIYIDTNGTYNKIKLEKNIDQQLNTVKQLMQRSNEWRDIHHVHAKVPLIQAIHVRERVACDISLSDGLGHSNTELVKFFCEIQPILRSMIIFLKIWLQRAELSNYITSYTLTLLIINFLQHIQYLPSVKSLQESIQYPEQVEPWIIEFDKTKINHLNLCKSTDLNAMLSEFFKFFSDASKFNHVICTYLGVLAPTTYFIRPGIKSLTRYITFINKYPNEAFIFSPMKVQGPFNLSENPAKQVSSATLQIFVNLCKSSHALLNSN